MPTPPPSPPPSGRAPSAWRRHPWLVRLVFYSLVLFLGIPLAFSQVLLRGMQETVSPPPPGYALGSVTADGLALRTWTVAGTSERPAVVLVHGLGDNLESYVDRADGLHR